MTTLLDCGHPKSPHESFTTGYGIDSDGKKYCYACCAKQDIESMRATGRAVLYLTKTDGKYFVSNWPGSLKIPVMSYKSSRHNIGRVRIDFWFRLEGTNWHGYQIGDNNEIAHCKRTK